MKGEAGLWNSGYPSQPHAFQVAFNQFDIVIERRGVFKGTYLSNKNSDIPVRDRHQSKYI